MQKYKNIKKNYKLILNKYFPCQNISNIKKKMDRKKLF